MGILDILAKLGILRYGAKAGTYTSGKDRPAELLMDDVYNAERDLTTKEDLRAAKDKLTGKTTADAQPTSAAKFCTHCGAPLREGARFCTGCGGKIG